MSSTESAPLIVSSQPQDVAPNENIEPQPPAAKRVKTEEAEVKTEESKSEAKASKTEGGESLVGKVVKGTEGGYWIDLTDNGYQKLTVQMYKGKLNVGIRSFFKDKKENMQWKPTQKGVAMNLEAYGTLKDLLASGVVDELVDEVNIVKK